MPRSRRSTANTETSTRQPTCSRLARTTRRPTRRGHELGLCDRPEQDEQANAYLGDVIIAYPRVVAQAAQQGHSAETRTALADRTRRAAPAGLRPRYAAGRDAHVGHPGRDTGEPGTDRPMNEPSTEPNEPPALLHAPPRPMQPTAGGAGKSGRWGPALAMPSLACGTRFAPNSTCAFTSRSRWPCGPGALCGAGLDPVGRAGLDHWRRSDRRTV